MLACFTGGVNLRAKGIQRNVDHREFAVLAHRQIDLTADLVVKVRPGVQTAGDIVQALVGDLAAQRDVGGLLLLELLQDAAQLGLARALRRVIYPKADQPLRGAILAQDAQCREVAALAAPLKTVVAGQRAIAGQRSLVGGAQCAGQAGVEQICVGVAQPGRCGHTKHCRQGRIHLGIAAGQRVFDRHTKGLALGHRQQQAAKHACGRRVVNLGGCGVQGVQLHRGRDQGQCSVSGVIGPFE